MSPARAPHPARVERPAPAVDVHAAAERRRAARALLLSPLLTDDGPGAEDLRLVRRHASELTRSFAEGLGYRLVVEPHAARLVKAGLGRDPSRPLHKRSGAAFTPRGYALLCLTLAALTRTRSQLLVDELVAGVRSAAADAGIDVDLDATAERRAMHAVLLALVRLGVLHERDGDLEHWADQRTQSLLDVRRELLPLLLATPLSSVTSPAELLDVAALPSAAGGARVAVRRALAERPVLSVDELTDDQGEWWRRNRNREREWFAERLGLELELRAEGALAVDPDDALSDVDFPGRGSAKHLALLLLEQLTAAAREQDPAPGQVWHPLPAAVVRGCVDAVVGRWRAGLRRDHRADPAAAASEAVGVLVDVGLLRRLGQGGDGRAGESEDGDGEDGGVAVHAAAARYATRTTLVDSASSGERSLFEDGEDEE